VTFKQAGLLKCCWCSAFSAKYGG